MEVMVDRRVIMKQYLDINHDDVVSIKEIIQFFFHFVTKVILYVIFLLLALIFIIFLFYFGDLLYNIRSGEDKPPLFDAYIIVSPSMVPTINVQDGIIIVRSSPDDLKQGDIISYLATDSYYAGKIITHRIIGIEESEDGVLFYRTKGDNNNVADAVLVNESNVYGKVLFKIPMLGYIRQFLSTYFGWILCIALPFLYLILTEITRVRKLIKNKKTESQKQNLNEENIEKI